MVLICLGCCLEVITALLSNILLVDHCNMETYKHINKSMATRIEGYEEKTSITQIGLDAITFLFPRCLVCHATEISFGRYAHATFASAICGIGSVLARRTVRWKNLKQDREHADKQGHRTIGHLKMHLPLNARQHKLKETRMQQ